MKKPFNILVAEILINKGTKVENISKRIDDAYRESFRCLDSGNSIWEARSAFLIELGLTENDIKEKEEE